MNAGVRAAVRAEDVQQTVSTGGIFTAVPRYFADHDIGVGPWKHSQMAVSIKSVGDLTCRVIGPQDGHDPQAVVIFCHGFGAPGDDLVPLANELSRLEPRLADSVLFVFPEAPRPLAEVPGGRAWWPIDLAALQEAAQDGKLRDLRQEAPPLLPDAREKLMTIIRSLQSETGLPLSRFVLGGFSQGSMLATDVSLRLEEQVGGLVIYSGTLLVEPEWRELAPARCRGMRVLQSHGTIDPLLPHEAATWLRDLLEEAGANVEFISFPGMHTIPPDAIVSSARLLAELIGSTSDNGG